MSNAECLMLEEEVEVRIPPNQVAWRLSLTCLPTDRFLGSRILLLYGLDT